MHYVIVRMIRIKKEDQVVCVMFHIFVTFLIVYSKIKKDFFIGNTFMIG